MQVKVGSSEFDSPATLSSVGGKISTKEIFRGLLNSTPESEISYELPAAKELVSQAPIPVCAGYCKRFSIRNDGQGPITLIVGAGGSISGSMNIPVSAHACHFAIRYTYVSDGGESYQLIRE